MVKWQGIKIKFKIEFSQEKAFHIDEGLQTFSE